MIDYKYSSFSSILSTSQVISSFVCVSFKFVLSRVVEIKMGVIGKLEVEVDIKSSGDLFHELYSSKPHHVSNISSNNIQNCDLHEGDIGKPGSVLFWNYTLEGNACVAKTIVEEIEENKKVRFKWVEGDLIKEYKTMTLTLELLPKGEITGVKWIAGFEKHADDGPYPTNLMDFCIAVTRDIEAHHLQG